MTVQTAPRPADVIRIVCRVYGVDKERLLSRLRTDEVAWPRAVAGVLIRECCGVNGSSAARALGRFPQMSVHWRKAVRSRIQTMPSEAEKFERAKLTCLNAIP
jgi:hypothetical protein